MFGWDMLGELGDKIVRFEELNVLFPVCIVLRLVNDCAVWMCVEDFLQRAGAFFDYNLDKDTNS